MILKEKFTIETVLRNMMFYSICFLACFIEHICAMNFMQGGKYSLWLIWIVSTFDLRFVNCFQETCILIGFISFKIFDRVWLEICVQQLGRMELDEWWVVRMLWWRRVWWYALRQSPTIFRTILRKSFRLILSAHTTGKVTIG